MPDQLPIELFSGPAYLALPRHETPWLIHSLVPRSGSTLIFAAAKQGKSSAILALASALGDPEVGDFFGLPITQHGPVAYLQLDTPSELWRGEYVEKMVQHGGLSFAQTYFHDRDTIPRLCDPFNILNPIHAHWLRAWVTAIQPHPVAVIIDTWRTVFRGAEKDDDLTTTVVNAVRKAVEPAAQIFVHHSRKQQEGHATGEEAHVEGARGSSNLPAMVDVVWRLSRKKWTVRGRGGDMTIPVGFDKLTGLPTLTNSAHALLDIVLKDPTLSSDRARAEKLAELSGISFNAAHMKVRRQKGLV